MARQANACAAHAEREAALPQQGTLASASGFSAPANAATPRRDSMHPMFKELFIDTDADDLAAEDDWRHRAPVPASPAGHDHQARHQELGEPAPAVTNG